MVAVRTSHKAPATRPSTRARTVGRWALIAGAWIVLLEAAGHIVLRVRPGMRHPAVTWHEAECFAGADWIADYFDEWWQIHPRWEPYVYWRSRPFEGAYIRTDAEGNRVTWQPEHLAPEPFRIYFFGGSTLWGLGARDDHTIPSLVSRQLTDARRPRVEVVNLAELGFVNTQELVLFMRELQADRVPGMAVFYDGVNDVFAAYQSGRPGIPQNEHRREREFNLLRMHGGRTHELVAHAAYGTLRQSAVLRLAERWAGRDRPRLAGPIPAAVHRQPLADAVHAVYLRNLDMIRALALEFDVDTLFYWQPSVFAKPLKTAHEAREARSFSALGALTESVDARVRECPRLAAIPGFHYVADIFRTVETGLFFDYCHTGEQGNKLVAGRITRDILTLLVKEGDHGWMQDGR